MSRLSRVMMQYSDYQDCRMTMLYQCRLVEQR